jgi:MurNAc alpha-1-phosphate uridylyltransferase
MIRLPQTEQRAVSQPLRRKPHTAIVLAAGLDRLHEAGIETAVVNVHYFADMLEAHVRRRATPRIVISDERETLLETGGGVLKALPLLGDDPFITFNSDSLWIEGEAPNLERLVGAWDPDRMDILMLVAPLSTSVGYDGRGDFHKDADGRLRRREGDERADFVYAGVAIVKPELVEGPPGAPFSANAFYNRAIASGRLYGLPLEGQWLHVGEPQAIAEAEKRIAASKR